MLQAPDITEDDIAAALREAHALDVSGVAFLPLGADVDSAAYRIEAKDGKAYFLKARRGSGVTASVMIPAWLSRTGMRSVIAPVPTRSGALGVRLHDFVAVLHPFVQGRSGWDVELTEQQWTELGIALARLHSARLPSELGVLAPRETWSPAFRMQVRRFLAQPGSALEHAQASRLAALLDERRAAIERIVRRAEQGAEALRRRPTELCLCHGDIHAGNILVDERGSLHLVDWDTLVLAPRERDLMFVGAGIGGKWNRREQSEWFHRGYGRAAIDRQALTYYRYERIVQDVAEICSALFSGREADADRAAMLRQFEDQFRAGNVVEMACAADPDRGT